MASTQLPDGSTVEIPPTHCPAGHELKSGSVLIGGDVAKRTYLCRTCGLQIEIRHVDGATTVVQRSPG